ncbi:MULTISPECIES: 2-oxoglutarate dehydrogenase complex dihydrolipoyllysine-residue succinyltransferase [Proteus]|jgi:2-oxoglutarate dehydrogenase E2 component (dihydrolipoamide succinyltransferase)|uniref:2-oxoglutarate dehydrogenase complex dihydrolipoyllysine-residue succinyltransferase n=1 Tax=Proteus TaxID=583 RepID=UPI00050177E5|nr:MULTISPECIES: 2-oxoglutarate dehydrogenase complex dihydrolipoyllysine-residue succinyltransferase [Proteus]KGA60094.1 dihydrolipoyllysine-residue succinyltransferase, E2 component of oxoglutarate dehydrogenase complex [Proteus vulgaris]MBG5971720.1 2-oxoglutarate dehydrogenase complex dihydrolipoyllysine-residue succinyltransferase [Proteus vulgaris]MBW3471536.1 2-oxoglutarate dehydrogenase complex dihydrolipoyllysine-residue succinyltransferase [Proteus vulgaris]MCH4254087.1 2-oxoglutarate
MSSVDILVPDLPESVADASVATWHKKPGDSIQRDEVLVEIETDKVVLEVPASEAGVLESILEEEGATVGSRQLLGRIRLGDSTGIPADVKPAQDSTPAQRQSADIAEKGNNDALSPTARRLVAEHDINPADVKGSGVGGRLTRQDIEGHVANKSTAQPVAEVSQALLSHRSEKRVPMTRLRKRVAERLLEAKNTTAMLTTFNEINMQPIKDLRAQYGEAFEKRHGVRLGFMSFYIKAVVEALKRYPEVNASIDGTDVVYHNYFDISIAVSTPRGLVTPVLRDADAMSMADIEKNIKALAVKGRDGKLTVEDLTGGNFTITNGGVFGSLMSTPIINPPQSAILGMHAIKDRPMAVDGQVVILPMMYLALSYDHRLIDGRESVGFLVTVKEMLEDPARLLLDV